MKVKFNDTLAYIREGEKKELTVTVSNNLYLPQYVTVRAFGLPEDWKISGKERCLGLEHWHGSKTEHTKSYALSFVPESVCSGKYTLTLEITANGRGERNYVPLTFIAE